MLKYSAKPCCSCISNRVFQTKWIIIQTQQTPPIFFKNQQRFKSQQTKRTVKIFHKLTFVIITVILFISITVIFHMIIVVIVVAFVTVIMKQITIIIILLSLTLLFSLLLLLFIFPSHKQY